MIQNQYDSICVVCNEIIFPGDNHLGCENYQDLKAKDQCIYCLRDEKAGDHSECQERLAKLRYELINLFKR